MGNRRVGGAGLRGNGEVWRVRADDGLNGAIKILRRPKDRYRFGRFIDEIAFLTSYADYPGILPLRDSHLPDAVDAAAWYVMPLATPIRQFVGDDPESHIVVGALAD